MFRMMVNLGPFRPKSTVLSLTVPAPSHTLSVTMSGAREAAALERAADETVAAFARVREQDVQTAIDFVANQNARKSRVRLRLAELRQQGHQHCLD